MKPPATTPFMTPTVCHVAYKSRIGLGDLVAALLLCLAISHAQSSDAASPLPGDEDADGIADAQDICLQSPPGYPVKDNGCPLLDGVLTGVKFEDGTSDLVTGASKQLDFLANLLMEFPKASIELHAHSDDRGAIRDQAILTRARLRTVGTYLMSRGISANRLVLRSFGGTRPLFDNEIAAGRANNNRIEVVEKIR